MALTPDIASLTFNADATVGTITDDTVYGGANPARADVAVYLRLWKMDEDEVETDVTVTTNTTPEVSTSWTFDSSTDGWYKAQLIIVNDFNIATAYTVGQVVYYTDGSLYRCIVNSTGNLPTDTSFFASLLYTDDLVVAADNVTDAFEDYLIIEQGKICAGTAATDWFKSKDCSNCDKLKLAESMLQKRGMVIAAQRFAALDLYVKAEQIARQLETDCESC